MKFKHIGIIFCLLVFFNCSIFNVTSLKPNQYARIKLGTEPGAVNIVTDKYGIKDVSFSLAIFDNIIGVADNTKYNTRFQLLDPDGSVKLVIGSIDNINTSKIKAAKFNFSRIGYFLIGDDGNIYIQNRFSFPNNNKNSGDISPSYILVFNRDGILQYTLGKNGTPDIPFNYIEGLDVDANGRLIVISRTYDVWNVNGYINKKHTFSINLGNLKFPGFDEKKYKAKIESVKIYSNGEKLLLSVAFYEGLRFKTRKIYDYSISEKSIIKTIREMPDPKNVLFNFVNEKLLYFWNIDEDDVRFMICNLDGSIINNIKLSFENKPSNYSNIICDKNGNIYSYHVLKKNIDIYKWE